MHTRKQAIFIWCLRIFAAVILLQTLFFKFTGAAESVYIFSTLGIEPWGRIGSGIAELISALLILYPRTTGIGAFIAMGIMAGAMFSHIAVLGIEVMGDGGQLFIYGVIVFVCCAILFVRYKQSLLNLIPVKKHRVTLL